MHVTLDVFDEAGEAQSLDAGWSVPTTNERARELQSFTPPGFVRRAWAEVVSVWRWGTAKGVVRG